MGIKLGEIIKELEKEKKKDEKQTYWEFIGKSPWLPRRMRIKKVEIKKSGDEKEG